jgi:hypothetical protein
VSEPRPENMYSLSVKDDGLDLIHLRVGEQRCPDDEAPRHLIDPDTADALLSMGEARRCERCGSGKPPAKDAQAVVNPLNGAPAVPTEEAT